jgi:aconitate hydratase
VHQVILGGDSGASLRDMLAAAALLKSKRVPSRLDLLVAPPSRQVLEVLAKSGALVDLIATGARLLEPDHRIISGELYPPPDSGLSLRTFDPEPGASDEHSFVVASAETLAFAVASGQVGDPRSFKRPVRVTVPRSLPTDDVLVVRKEKGRAKGAEAAERSNALPVPPAWKDAERLTVILDRVTPSEPAALLLQNLDDVRWAARRATRLGGTVRAVIARYIPSGTVPIFAGLGILALTGDDATIERLSREGSVAVPSPATWNGGETIRVGAGDGTVDLKWVAVGVERDWTTAGTAGDEKPV